MSWEPGCATTKAVSKGVWVLPDADDPNAAPLPHPPALQVGADGVLAIETSNSLETTVDVQEGMEIDRGYISPQFVNNK